MKKLLKRFSVLVVILFIFCEASAFEVPFKFPENWNGRYTEKSRKLYDEHINLWKHDKKLKAMQVLGEAIDADPFCGRNLLRIRQIALRQKGKKNFIPELKYFHTKLEHRFLKMVRKYPDNPDFEYEYIRIQDLETKVLKRKLTAFLKKYPNHEYGRIALAYVYYSIYHGINNVSLARKIMLKRLQHDPDWKYGWIYLGETYMTYVHKKYRNYSKGSTCFMLSFMFTGGDSNYEDTHYHLGYLSNLMSRYYKITNNEKVNLMRNHWYESVGTKLGPYIRLLHAIFMRNGKYAKDPETAEKYYGEIKEIYKKYPGRICTCGQGHRDFKKVSKTRNDYYRKHPEMKRKLDIGK